jgi:hypothetical protein
MKTLTNDCYFITLQSLTHSTIKVDEDAFTENQNKENNDRVMELLKDVKIRDEVLYFFVEADDEVRDHLFQYFSYMSGAYFKPEAAMPASLAGIMAYILGYPTMTKFFLAISLGHDPEYSLTILFNKIVEANVDADMVKALIREAHSREED